MSGTSTIKSSTPVGTFASELKRDPNAFPLQDSAHLWQLAKPEHLEFIKTHTGIEDEEELKRHILSIQREAYQVFPYQCIRYYAFAVQRITLLPNYEQFIKLGKEREGAILLDVGCCFGTDSRKAADDGWPAENIVASDIHPQFWELGHKLFRSTPASFPATFVPGDALSDAHLTEHPALPTSSHPSALAPLDLRTLTSLNPLAGRASAIFAGAVFHLFPASGQARLARALAGLLAPHPGATIAGSQTAAPDGEEGVRDVLQGAGGERIAQFLHSPASWTRLWDGDIFARGVVRVEAVLEEKRVRLRGSMEADGEVFYTLRWAVTRV